MSNLPTNHRNHILERKSENFFRSQIPEEWV